MKQSHLEGTQVLIDRNEMLRRIPQQSITCEVGVADGTFSRTMFDVINPSKHYMIDLWNTKRYGDNVLKEAKSKFPQEIQDGRIEIIRKDSLLGISQLADHTIDFLYIDTNHQYELTISELRLAVTKIKPSGIIAGHDYTPGSAKKDGPFLKYGVIEAVSDFLEEHPFYLKYLTLDENKFYSFALQRTDTSKGVLHYLKKLLR